MNAKAIQFIVIVGLIGTAMVAAFNAPAAYAAVSNHSGTICKNYNASEATKIDYITGGTRSVKTSATEVICPLVRSTTNSDGATAYVDIIHSGSRTTTCSLWSHDYNGAYLGAISDTWTGSGFHEFALYLGSGKSAYWSDYSVACTIPGNVNGAVTGIDLVEY